MALLLSTTGSPASVIINDLGARTFVHPVTNLNLELEYQLSELLASDDLRNSLINNEITLSYDGFTINVAQFDDIARGNMQKARYDIGETNFEVDRAKYASTAGYALLLNNQNGAYYLNRTNHTGSQVAATISDFTSAVLAVTGGGGGGGGNFSGTAGYSYFAGYASTAGFAQYAEHATTSTTATTANNATLLNNQNGAFYLNRTNHTGTQLAATISDFTSTARNTISIDPGSTQFLQYNNSTGQLSVAALAIASVTVNNVSTSIANFVAVFYSTGTEFQSGDVIILTAVPTGTEVYMQNGGITGTVADFTVIEGPELSDAYIRSLFGATTPLQYNPVSGVFSMPQASGSVSGFLSSANFNIFSNKQNSSTTLDALSGFNSNGFMVQIAPDTFTSRTIVGTSNKISVTNGDGIATNPTINVGPDIVQVTQTNTYQDFDQIFRSTRLKINNPANTFNYSIVGAAIVANRNITLPLLSANDTMVTEAFAQTLTNKTISGTQNTITNISQWVISGGVDGNATNRFVDWAAGIAMNLSPYIVPVNARIRYISAASTTAITWSAEIRVNGVAITSLAIVAADSATSGLISFDVSIGDKITLFVSGSGVPRPTINVHFAER